MATSRVVMGCGIGLLVLAAGTAVFVASGERPQPPTMAQTGTQAGAKAGSQTTSPALSPAQLAVAEAHVPPKLTFTPVFEPCAHCHEIGEGARTSSGPVLNGIVGRKAGSRDDYPYSQAMKESGIVWSEANLRQFLQSPGAMVEGTRMAIGGLSDDMIGPLIEFLKTVPAS